MRRILSDYWALLGLVLTLVGVALIGLAVVSAVTS